MKINIKATIAIVALSTAFAFIGCGNDDIKTEFSENPNGNSIENAFAAKTVVPLASCVAPGWASQNGGTTGGGTAAETTVTTYAQLKSAIENTAVKVIKVT